VEAKLTRRYPRRLAIDGKRVQAWSPAEEENVLRKVAQQFDEQATELDRAGNAAGAQEARRKAARVVRRIDKVGESAASWDECLRCEDDEVLEILMAIR
jgi:hypothetical protein